MKKYFLSIILLLTGFGFLFGQNTLSVSDENDLSSAQRESIDQMVEKYRVEKGLIPGISVAIMKNGHLIYDEGFGMADVENKLPATSETVYGWASISKTIGGVLSVIYSSRIAPDGIPMLDLNLPTSYYLQGLPEYHRHSLKNLLQNTGCVAHYSNSEPALPAMPLKSYHTQFEASEDLWNTPLIENCEIGKDYNYSTHAFTFVGAVLEEITGKSLAELIKTEITNSLNLPSLQLQFEKDSITYNPYRSVAYDWRKAIDYENSYWKILGGGIESNVIDLAKYGDAIRSGRLVAETLRDSLLWNDGGHDYGLGWRLSSADIEGKKFRVAEHSGSQTGARSHLQIYRDAGLTIAVLTNDKWWKRDTNQEELRHNPKELANKIGEFLLSDD